MAQPFQFVDGLNPDRASKRRMRQHVMKGKNAGRTVQRKSRLDVLAKWHNAPADVNISTIAKPLVEEERHGNGEDMPVPDPEMRFGGAFQSLALPVEVAAYPMKVINDCEKMTVLSPYSGRPANVSYYPVFTLTAERMYPTRLGLSLEDAKGTWLQILFTDVASKFCKKTLRTATGRLAILSLTRLVAYHCNISLMQACNEMFLDYGETSPKAAYFLSRTYAHLQERLDSAEALSDSTIGIVVSLISQEQIRNGYPGSKIHIDGLKRMVQLRGGLGRLEDNRMLLLKICK